MPAARVLREGPIPSTTKLIAHCTTSASKVEQIGPQSCLIRHIHLNSCQPTTTSSNISTTFCRELFHNHQEAENAFQPRVHRIPKHRFLRYGNKQSYFLLAKMCWLFSSVQLSHSSMSYSLRPHESQHARPPCPSPTPGVYPNPCPLSQWCHPTISSSVIPFSSCPQSFPALGSFPMSQLFASGGQSTGVSASASVPPMNTQNLSPLGWTGWIFLQSKGLSRVFSNTTFKSINSSALNLLHRPTLTSIHDYWKNHRLD